MSPVHEKQMVFDGKAQVAENVVTCMRAITTQIG